MTTTSKYGKPATAGATMPAGAMTLASTGAMPKPAMNAAYATEERQEMPMGAMEVATFDDMPMGAMDSVGASSGSQMPGGGMDDAGSDMPQGAMQGAGESWQMDVAEGHPCGCN